MRLVLVTCLLGALMLVPSSPATATVSTRTEAFSGTLQSPVRPAYRLGRIDFKARIKIIDPARGPKRFLVTAILAERAKPTFRKVLFDCDQGLGVADGGPPFPRIPVADNRFAENLDFGPRDIRFTGKFTDRAGQASGTLRVHGDFPENGVTGCDTGLVRWTAD